MIYQVFVVKKARKELARINISNPYVARKILAFLDLLKTVRNPHLLPNVKKLQSYTNLIVGELVIIV